MKGILTRFISRFLDPIIKKSLDAYMESFFYDQKRGVFSDLSWTHQDAVVERVITTALPRIHDMVMSVVEDVVNSVVEDVVNKEIDRLLGTLEEMLEKLNSEEFIDGIINRINRKQLIK